MLLHVVQHPVPVLLLLLSGGAGGSVETGEAGGRLGVTTHHHQCVVQPLLDPAALQTTKRKQRYMRDGIRGKTCCGAAGRAGRVRQSGWGGRHRRSDGGETPHPTGW